MGAWATPTEGGFNNKDAHKLQRAKDAAAAAVPTAA